MKRLFIAVKVNPDGEFISRFRELKSALRQEPVKWVEEYNIHITLKFLGETEEGRIPAIHDVLSQVAASVRPFTFSLEGLGIFGSRYQPRVIWTGIRPYDTLAGLMGKVHTALEPAGFERDRQNLVPHLTLGRIKFLHDKQGFQETLEAFRDLASKPFRAERMILFESILKKEGPEYRVVQTHSFTLQ